VRRLRLNYRTTAEIRRSAERVLEGRDVDDLDLGIDNLNYDLSLRYGPDPEFRHFDRESQEAEFIVERIKSWLKAGVPDSSICVATRTNSQLKDRYEAILSTAGIATVYVERKPSSDRGPGCRLATTHRMKGLEFSRKPCDCVTAITTSGTTGTSPETCVRAASESIHDEAFERS
jgi:superfamily I DNA/RNA helicase